MFRLQDLNPSEGIVGSGLEFTSIDMDHQPCSILSQRKSDALEFWAAQAHDYVFHLHKKMDQFRQDITRIWKPLALFYSEEATFFGGSDPGTKNHCIVLILKDRTIDWSLSNTPKKSIQNSVLYILSVKRLGFIQYTVAGIGNCTLYSVHC